MPDKLRVGLIGASVGGSWGTRAHIPAIQHLPDVELKAVATTRQETADATAKKYGIEHAFGHYPEMLARDDFDLVSVVVRVPGHYDLVMKAIEAGKNVYCEWPLGANLREAEEMAEAAEKRAVMSAVGIQGRLDPAQNYIRKLIADGYIGEVVACHMTYVRSGVLERPSDRTWQRDRSKGANTLTILGGHSLDAVNYCVGELAEVSARVATQVKQWRATDTNELLDVDSPDNVLLSGRLKNGALASVYVATLPFHGPGFRMEVWGREGTIVARAAEGPNIGPMKVTVSKGEAPLEELRVPDEFSFVPEDMPKGSPYNIGQFYARIADAIGSGEQLQAPTFADAVKHHRLIDAIERSSAEDGRAVPVA
jgi:predicted dehydrogenase